MANNLNSAVTALFGDLRIEAPTLVSDKVERGTLESTSATVSLRAGDPSLHRLALNDTVVLEHEGQRVFTGEVVSAEVVDDVLTVRCSAVASGLNQRGGGVARGDALQLARMLILDHGGKLAQEDDENVLCPARTRAIDWDALVEEMEQAPDLVSLIAVVRNRTNGQKLQGLEGRLLAEVMQMVVKQIKSRGLESATASEVKREDFQDALPTIRGCSWRFRKLPDQYEVVVPMRRLVAGSESIQLGSVEFRSTDGTVAEYLDKGNAKAFASEWQAEAYAWVGLKACDLWTAKTTGLARIMEAMASVGFVYSYACWHQKTSDGVYRPIRYERPHGMPAVVGRLFRVTNVDSGDCWIGPIDSEADACRLEQLAEKGGLLRQATGSRMNSEMGKHVRRALNWRYKADLALLPVDAFLHAWISLEMLFQRETEGTSALVRRLPFTILSVGERPGSIRNELQKKWVPLRDKIVHRALEHDPSLEEGVRRLHFFSDCAIAFALGCEREFGTYEEWLTYLDDASRKRKGSAAGEP